MNERKPFVCPDHGEKCSVTLPNRMRAMRVRCRAGQPSAPCVDRYFLVPTCAVNGHRKQFRVVSFSEAVEVVAHCSGCDCDYSLPLVDVDGGPLFPVGV